jgi:uncharacterized protein
MIARKRGVKNPRTTGFVLVVLLLLLVFSVINIAFIYYTAIKKTGAYNPNFPKFLSLDNITFISMRIPAVDDKGNGIITTLVVEAMPGTGRTLVDIDNLLFWADTQQSIRIARLVAANFTSLDITKYDLVFSIHANATVIGGESAGAALTIATIAALSNRSLNDKVMITGTINHDGTIGPVSEIIAKAGAAKQRGASLFLVPLLQSRDVVYETREHCENFGPTKVCTVEQLPKRIDVTNQTGIETIEVGSVKEALNYFLE